jgi:hypothetical protein
MALELINVGLIPNDRTGDPIRVALIKINNNFTELFATDVDTSDAYTVGDTPDQIIFQAPAEIFTQARFQINSSDPLTHTNQNITLSASIVHNTATVGFTAFGTVFTGDPLTRYNMDISGGNVRIMCSPLTSATLTHFIACQITYMGSAGPSLDLALNGYPEGSVLSTEDGITLITET